MTCFNSPDGMGVCLRDRMTDAGILPRTVVAEVPDQTPEASAAIAQPAMDAAAEVAGPATTADDLIAATFGLLRAEPDGSIVIAGSGTPGTEVEIYANDTLLGKAIVEPSGDWVLVPDAPLPPGGAEITLGETGSTGRAAQAFVVAINEDLSSEPLVVASSPGSISQVLQGLDPLQPAVDAPAQMAAAAPAQTPAAVTASETAIQPAQAALPTAPAATQAPATDPALELTPAAPATVPAEAPTVAASAPDAAAAPDAATPAETAAQAPAADAPAADLAQGDAVSQPAAIAELSPLVPAVASATGLATTEPAASAQAPAALGASPPTIDAIEIDGDKTFFAGAGPDGSTLRLYVDEQFIADTAVADGRWLVEAGKVLTKPSQRIRVDLLRPGSAEVASRAEVNFVIDQPVAVALAEEPAAPVAQTVSDATVATAEPIELAPVVGEIEAAPTEIAAAAVEPPADNAAPAAPASATATTAQIEAPATPAADAVPTMVAVSVGDPNAERFGAGKAIIRRGDNLWTIARRVYGEGIKYTTIYEANTGQIRDPDRIYPGQVFELPGDQN